MVARDTIVIGASAGGVEALPRVLGALPAGLPAAVVVAMHLSPSSTYLVEILRKASRNPVAWAEQGERTLAGHVYVAPPDHHATIDDGHLILSSGPRENHVRPSIDRLFRSAAARRGRAVIGVLLTGTMDDGVQGLQAIQEAGGATFVQDPSTAAYPDLPRQALLAMTPDAVLDLDALGQRLGVLAGSAVDANLPDSLRAIDGRDAEGALWNAVRAVADRATLLGLLAADAERHADDARAADYRRRALRARDHAAALQQLMQAILQDGM